MINNVFNPMAIEMYIENKNGEKLPLLADDWYLLPFVFGMYVDQLNFNGEIEYETFETSHYIFQYLKEDLNGEDLKFEGVCNSSKSKKTLEDFMYKQKTGFKLHYINNRLKEHYYSFVNLKDIPSKMLKTFDEYEIELELKRVSYWIKEVPIKFNDYSQDDDFLWVWGDMRPLVYSKGKTTFTDGKASIENKGHEPAPFILYFGDTGATSVYWQLENEKGLVTDSEGIAYKGMINHAINEQFFIDSYNKRIYSTKTDYSHLRERTSNAFFKIPQGSFNIVVGGATNKLGGILYEQYRKI